MCIFASKTFSEHRYRFFELIITYFSHFLSALKEGWILKLIQLLELLQRCKKVFCVFLGTVKISVACKKESKRVNAGKNLF